MIKVLLALLLVQATVDRAKIAEALRPITTQAVAQPARIGAVR